MAITNNGQPQGPIQFTDATTGARVFIGGTTPTTPSAGDIWIDSDVQNNAGKNTISETTLSTATVALTIPNSYKDVWNCKGYSCSRKGCFRDSIFSSIILDI